MSNEEKEILQQDNLQETLDEIMVEQAEEKIEKVEVTEEKEEKKVKKEMSPSIKLVLVGLVDQVVAASLAVVVLFLFNVILQLFGYQVKEMIPMYLIMYVIVNVFFKLICNACKFKGSFGTRIVCNE